MPKSKARIANAKNLAKAALVKAQLRQLRLLKCEEEERAEVKLEEEAEEGDGSIRLEPFQEGEGEDSPQPPINVQGNPRDKVKDLDEDKMFYDLKDSILRRVGQGRPHPGGRAKDGVQQGATQKVTSRPRPLIPSPSFCFVCVAPSDQNDERGRTKVNEADCFSLLTSILEFPPVQARRHLRKLEGAEKWIGLCHNCLNLMREVSTVKERIIQLEKDARRCKREMVEALKGSLLEGVWGVNKRHHVEGTGVSLQEEFFVIESILRFVRGRKYYSLHAGLRTRSGDNQSAPVPSGASADKHSRPTRRAKCRPRRHFGTKKSSRVKPRKESETSEDKADDLHPNQQEDTEVDEDLLFLEVDVLDQMKAEDAKDPLAEDDDDDGDVAVITLLNEESEPLSPFQSLSPPVPAPCRGIKRKAYYCGLCDNNTVYRSEKQLQLHTNKCHRPPTPQNPGKGRKRRRKQKFSSGSDSEEGDAGGDYLLPNGAFSNKRVGLPIDDNSPALLEPASAIVAKKIPTIKISIKSVGMRGESDNSETPEKIEEDEESKPDKLLATEWEHGYDCPACPNVKNYGINRITQHLAIHQRRPYKCTVCSALLPSDDVLMEEHWKQKHSGELLPPQRFSKVSLEPGKFWMCEGESCDEGFTSEEDRNTHELNCSLLNPSPNTSPPVFDSPYSCMICDKPSRNSEEWRLHRALHHPEVDRMSCLCCDLSFAEKTVDGGGSLEVRNDVKMLEHIKKDHVPADCIRNYPPGRIHDECESCGLVFWLNDGRDTRAHFLEVHGVPQGGKIYSCPLACGVMFARSRGVRLHVHLCHLSKDLQICDVCGESFKRAETLKGHVFRKHGIQPEGATMLTCPVEGCDFQAIQKQILTHHSQMVHEGVRKHSCKYCGKRFSDSSKLRVHRQIHENKDKKPYQCEICGASFAVRNYLYIHKRLSHEGRTFPSTNRKRLPKTSAAMSTSPLSSKTSTVKSIQKE